MKNIHNIIDNLNSRLKTSHSSITVNTFFAMKKYILFGLYLIFAGKIIAQQEVQYTHYAYNKLAFNPAVAGSMGNGVLGGIYRQQWSGIPGAPRTASIFGHMPIMKNRCGIGITLTNDRLGLSNTNIGVVSYAYRFPIGSGMTLSMGLQGEIEYNSLDWSKAEATTDKDQVFGTELSNRVGGNAGAGLYIQHRKFYVGFSAPRIFKNTLYQNIGTTNSKRDYRSYFLTAGVTLPLNNSISLVPMTMVSFGPSIPTTFDLGANFLFLNRFSVGANWRVLDSFDGLIMFQVNKKIRTGFSYDFTSSPLMKSTMGSWELLFEYQFKCNENELVNSIRYF